MPSMTLPVPPQFGQSAPLAFLPLPLQTGQMSSPVPGVPAGASSPGFVWLDWDWDEVFISFTRYGMNDNKIAGLAQA